MLRSVLLLLGTLVALPASALEQLPASASESPSIRHLDADEVTELMGGETIRAVDRGNPLRAEVIGLIQAPRDELAEILLDYPQIPVWAPSTGDVVVVGTEGECTLIEGVTQIPWPISDRTWRMCSRGGTETVDGQDAFVYRFDHVEGSGNIDASFGFWVLYSLPSDPDWTYVRYVVNADPGIAIPQAILRWVTNGALPDLISGLRDRHDELH